MKLQHFLTTRHLMQIVDILGNNCFQFSCLLQFCQLQMCCIWFCSVTKHLVSVEFEKFFRLSHKECMA